ncbi:response regulator transcription factor [Nocardioides sp.]|uniref:response regulator transcription factor n=1 Tax=Nocardioides sp. TaxID=35761 RepID=UPI0039E35AA0
MTIIINTRVSASRSAPGDLATLLDQQFRAPVQPPASYLSLTEKEREVFTAVARGLSNTEIAALVFAGESTVKTHVGSILRKLGLRDRVQIVVFAHEHGLV